MIFYVVLGLVVVWIAVLTFFVFKMKSHYNNLVTRTKARSLDDILDAILEKDKTFEHAIGGLQKDLKKITEDAQHHYQKMGFVRFNPFDRVGGDQSFVVSFLNGKNNGIILNFLYTRDGVRIYAKRVADGVSEEYDLSLEEKEAIKKAR